MNRKLVGFLLTLVITTLACGGIAPAASDQPSVETIVAATLQAATQNAVNNPPQPSGVPVSFQNVSFIIPDGLATGANSEIVPLADESTNSDPWSIAPEHIRFTLSRTDAFPSNFDMEISIIPANDYMQMNEGAAGQIPLLQQKLTSGDFSEVAVLPPFNAALIIDAQNAKVDFPNGSGIRSIQEYHQSHAPITNDYLIYSFQGITQDGRYYISVIAPIRAPVLVDETYFPDSTTPTPTIPEGGVPFNVTTTTFDAQVIEQYNQAITEALNQLTEDQFTPSISTLDALIQSIQIQ